MMKDGAILINTARGALINETDLAEELSRNRIFACLDVTEPEPPSQDSAFRKLPNVILTPHLAGCMTDTLYRMSSLAVDELERFHNGEKLQYQVRKEQLISIA